MSESNPAAPSGESVAPPNTEVTPAKIAGKFTDRAAAVQGLIEINKHLGLEDMTPEDVNTRFKDDASLEKVYKSRESLQGRLKPAAKTVEAKAEGLEIASTVEIAGESEQEITLAGVIEKAGLDPKELAESFTKDGTLTDEQIGKIRQADKRLKFLSKDAINDHVAGQAARAELRQIRDAAALKSGDEIAGGAEQHKLLREWAKNPENFPKQQLADLNALVRKSPDSYPTMIRMIADAHKQSVGAGKSNALITGGGGGNATASGFTSSKEMLAAMDESSKKHGSWESDPALLKRLEATPTSVRRHL